LLLVTHVRFRRRRRHQQRIEPLSKATITAAVAALLLTTAPLTYAQTAGNRGTSGAIESSHETTATEPSPVGEMIQPDQVRASKMLGSTVYDLHNRDIGKVGDLVLNRDGKVAAVVVDVGSFLGMGGKNVAVQMSDLKTDNNRLTLDMTKEQLQQANNYELENKTTGAGSSTSPVKGGHLGSAAGGNTAPRQ
jgi:sporulation protein YlmC with PRC-barrel domain